MTEKDNPLGGVIRSRRRRIASFADVVGAEAAFQYGKDKLEADRRIQQRRREMGGSSMDLLDFYGYPVIDLPDSEED